MMRVTPPAQHAAPLGASPQKVLDLPALKGLNWRLARCVLCRRNGAVTNSALEEVSVVIDRATVESLVQPASDRPAAKSW
jgi:hypothetical protein